MFRFAVCLILFSVFAAAQTVMAGTFAPVPSGAWALGEYAEAHATLLGAPPLSLLPLVVGLGGLSFAGSRAERLRPGRAAARPLETASQRS